MDLLTIIGIFLFLIGGFILISIDTFSVFFSKKIKKSRKIEKGKNKLFERGEVGRKETGFTELLSILNERTETPENITKLKISSTKQTNSDKVNNIIGMTEKENDLQIGTKKEIKEFINNYLDRLFYIRKLPLLIVGVTLQIIGGILIFFIEIII